MKVLFSVGLIFAISQVGAFAQYGGGGQSGGGSGGDPNAPSSPATFSAGVIGGNSPLVDRLLALNVPGQSTMPLSVNNQYAGTLTIPASSWNIGYKVFDPLVPSMPVMVSVGDLFTGTGATGYWNGTDPGWTILPNGTQGVGYAQFAMQICLDLGYPYLRSIAQYQYLGQHIFNYGKLNSPQNTVGTRIIPWSVGLSRYVN
jgi:hypothetical protein